MSTHKEIAFEEEICEHLGSHGWVYVAGEQGRSRRGW
jgi:type I restriction enzyme R subunit